LVNIIFPRYKFSRIATTVIVKTFLPNRKPRPQPMRKPALDQLHGTFQRDSLWRNKEMDVIGHRYECVQFITTFPTIMLQGFEK